MDNMLTIALEARHAERNHHRRYELRLGRDLFGAWTVAILYGRMGQGGQERRYASSEPEAMRAVIRTCLRRRLSAPKRIGCAYRLVGLSRAPGFDFSGWLSDDLMVRFSVSPEIQGAV